MAAIGHLHQLLLGARQVGAAVADERRVDVDLAHVVDDDGDAAPFAVVEDVVEKRGLAGSEKTGKHRDGKAIGNDGCVAHGWSEW